MKKKNLLYALAVVFFPLDAKSQGRSYVPGNEGINAFSELCSTAMVANNTAAIVEMAFARVTSIFKGDTATETSQLGGWRGQMIHQLCDYMVALNQYRQAVHQVNALTGSRNVRDLARNLGGIAHNSSPTSRILGQGLAYGRASIGGDADAIMRGDQYYEARNRNNNHGMRFTMDEMRRREQVTANVKAISLAGIRDAEARVERLEAALQRTNGAMDVTEQAAVRNVLSMNEQNLQAHKMRLQNIGTMLATNDRVDRQRRDQYLMQLIEAKEQEAMRGLGAGGTMR